MQSGKNILKKSVAHATDFFVWLPLFIGLSIPITIHAQEKTSILKKILTRATYDTNYVESYYSHHLHVTLVSLSQNQLTTISTVDPNISISIKPNTSNTFGIGLDYKFLTLEITREIDAISKPDPNKGESESYSFRLGYTGRRVLCSALIQSHSGMYISNPEDFVPNWDVNTQGYPKRPDIVNTLLFGSMNYFFNHYRYSTMASLWQIDRQKKSAGSVVAGITASVSTLKGDSALTPPLPSVGNTDPARLVSETNYLTGLNVGYCYNFIYRKKLFLNFNVVPGVNIQFGEYKTNKTNTKTYNSNLGVHGDIRITGGYNGELYYCGAHYSNYIMHNNISDFLDINQFNSYLRFFIGRRFDLRRKK
jgi:hypothetical protein